MKDKTGVWGENPRPCFFLIMLTKKREIIFSFGIIALAVTVVILLPLYGTSRRVYSQRPQRQIITEPQMALNVWELNGIKGRVLILFDRYINAIPPLDRYPGIPPQTKDNYLYVAFRKNIVRKVYHIIPDAAWPEAEKNLVKNWQAYREGEGYRTDIEGTPILIIRLKNITPLKEKVLISINGDYWNDDDISYIVTMLENRVLDSDIITLAGKFSEKSLGEIMPYDTIGK